MNPKPAAWILLAPLALLLGGCYTMLQHPAVRSGIQEERPDQSFNCAACHDTGRENGNFRAPVVFHPDIQGGGYAYFNDYPWWWAEPATLKYVIPDSSRTQPVDSLRQQTTSGAFQVFQRIRTSDSAPAGRGSSAVGTTEQTGEEKKEEKKEKPRIMKRKRR